MVPLLTRRKSLSNVDAAWLKMEIPTNLMMITGLFIFDEPLDFERLQTTIAHRLLRFKRFQQRVVPARFRSSRWYWEPDPNFDLTYHLDRITLPPASDEVMLRGLVNTLMSAPLAYDRPLWQFHLIENYGRGCVLLGRMHHCIADGISLIQVLLSLTDEEPDAPLAESETGPSQHVNPLGALLKPVTATVRTGGRVTRKLVGESLETLTHPTRLVDLAKLGADGAASLARLTLRPPDQKTLFKGALDVAKRAAWSEAVPLAEVKAIGQAVGGTVNDVLLTAMTGALRRYLQGRGEPVEGLNFRAAVPVNLRPFEDGVNLGNKFGLVFLSLPVGLADPIERVFEFKRRMAALKGSTEAVVAFGILNVIGFSPQQIQDMAVNMFGSKATCVMTNVPGPRQTLYFAGKPIRTMMFWAPQSGRLGLGVSLLSYAGEVRLGVATDAGLAPDPETIIENFHLEFAEFRRLVGLAESKTEAQTSPAATASDGPRHCQALTKSGQPCKNQARPDSRFCYVHQK